MSRISAISSVYGPTLLGAVWLVCGLLTGCVEQPSMPTLEQVERSTPKALESADGQLSRERSRAILVALARQAGASEKLLRHVAVEDRVSDSPLVLGNKVTLLRDGSATYRAMYQAIRRAKHHINLEVYIFEHDAVGQELIALLIARQQQGVQVNLIYDDLGSVHTPPAFFQPLRLAGAKVLEFNPLNPVKARTKWTLDHRDHRKLLIIDGKTAFTGGINFSSVYSSGSLSQSRRSIAASDVPWRDTHVKIEGPVVAEFQKLFLINWSKQHGGQLPPRRYFPHIATRGHQVVRAVGSTPESGISIIHTTLLSAIAHAERSIYLTNAYFVPDPELLDKIRGAARRGVDVRMVLPGQTDFWAPLYAGRSHYHELLEAGVKLYERRDALLHAKTAVVDGVWSTVGSANLDQRSFLRNDEVNAVVIGEDFADQMEAMFREDVVQSTAVILEEWNRRGLRSRVKEMAARIWGRWL
jgi:cardiolipin synthase A/B